MDDFSASTDAIKGDTTVSTQPFSPQDPSEKPNTLDKDLGKLTMVAEANMYVGKNLVGPGFAILFICVAALYANTQIVNHANAVIIIIAAALGGYMAINIGANDVANNVGPAVGAKALTLVGALVIAAIFESAGALIAGGDVVSTISKGIIDPALVPDSDTFIWAMMSALLAAAMWLHLATFLGAPVSTTHSIVGGVMGAGIAAVGFNVVNWATMGKIAASWVISPLLGGIIAAFFLAILKINVINKEDKIAAARRWVPLLVAVMASAFSCYLIMKGLKKIWKPDTSMLIGIGVLIFFITNAIMRPVIRKQSEGLENRSQSLRVLFHVPLICSAALLSFAHGANDVA
ncbi:MAG: inorganic phosphate transporter, partial [Rhodospirillales bacterium]|nr:inorganic phosphate transporter [Rhodospirillales bacterium]